MFAALPIEAVGHWWIPGNGTRARGNAEDHHKGKRRLILAIPPTEGECRPMSWSARWQSSKLGLYAALSAADRSPCSD
jgi:hypothetical protein